MECKKNNFFLEMLPSVILVFTLYCSCQFSAPNCFSFLFSLLSYFIFHKRKREIGTTPFSPLPPRSRSHTDNPGSETFCEEYTSTYRL